MANIALDAGKVVLKDGKASCTCCGGTCGGCETFYELTGATSINVSFVISPFNPASATFSMIEPYTSFDYSDGERTFYGNSGVCGVSFGWYYTEYSWSYNSSISLEVFKQNNICILRISGSQYGAPGADYTFYTNGSIEVAISDIFGTHDILETGEGCQVIYDDPIYSICNPISVIKTVTIS